MRRPVSPETPDADDFAEDAYDGPSKSQKKRDMIALQELGVALTELGKESLQRLALPEELLAAVLEARKITAHGALKRQRQYIGRLMRDVDPAPIQAYLDALKGDNDRHTAWLHHLEQTRDRLLENDDALTGLLTEHPLLDIPELRQLIRNARAERASHKAPKHFRALFQYLKDLYPEPALHEAGLDAAGGDPDDDEEDDDD